MFVCFPECGQAKHIGILLSDAFNSKDFLHDVFIAAGKKAMCPPASLLGTRRHDRDSWSPAPPPALEGFHDGAPVRRDSLFSVLVLEGCHRSLRRC